VKGCNALLAPNGTLCPDVIHPPIRLTAKQAEELVDILTTRNPVPIGRLCGYYMPYGFVFVDIEGTPVAEVTAGYGCYRLWSRPAVGPEAIQTPSSERASRLGKLLREVGLVTELSSDKQALADRQAALDGDRHWARFRPARSGVRGRQDALSTEQKRRLCAWQAQASRFWSPGGGYACPDGWEGTMLNFDECQRTFPGCDVDVGATEHCLERFRFDPCFEHVSECKQHRRCFWGFDATTTRRTRCEPAVRPRVSCLESRRTTSTRWVDSGSYLQKRKIDKCVQAALTRKPQMRGRLRVEYTLKVDGTGTPLELFHDLTDDEFVRCICHAFVELPCQVLPDGNTEYIYPITVGFEARRRPNGE